MRLRVMKVIAVMVLGTWWGISSASAEDHYFSLRVEQIKFVEGKLPAASTPDHELPEDFDWRRREAMSPRVIVAGTVEAYLSQDFQDEETKLLVHSTTGEDVAGTLFWPKPDYSAYIKLKFVLPVSLAAEAHRVPFLEARLEYYRDGFYSGRAGTAWYRHQIIETTAQLGKESVALRQRQRFFGNNDVSDSFALFSGGRAVSENLQLDRQLPTSGQAKATLALTSIEGITVKEFDWGPAIEGLDPKRDVLAPQIPDDQYAIFIPNFRALIALADEYDKQGSSLLTLAEPRAEDASVRERYERQLCLSLSTSVRLLGSRMIASVAVTGSDPYLRTGADVAVLFEAKSVGVVRRFVDGQLSTRGSKYKSAKPVSGEIAGVSYTGIRSPDRVVCSYAATLGKTVVVTNSLAQLQRLVETHQGTRSSLAKLPEYTFFRERYPLGDGQETALVLISDKTIRRWCGPRWRIGSSRRTRATATMTELQATHMDALVNGQVEQDTVTAAEGFPDAGELQIGATGVKSSIYGTLDFQTPIVELEITHVTPEEAQLYNRWRDGYQSYWSNFFDPIAVRVHVTKSKLETDVTVMPLIDRSDYQQFIEISKGAELPADFGDLHAESLLHWVLAVNHRSPLLQENAGIIKLFAPQITTDPFSWIGDGIAIYLDQDSLWRDLKEVAEESAADGEQGDFSDKAEDFMEEQLHRFPLGVHVDVKSGFKLTLFLAGFRTFIESLAPGLTKWTTGQHRDQPYVKIAPTADARRLASEMPDKLALYYVATAESLVISLNESLIKRAIDRRLDRLEKAKTKTESKEDSSVTAWAGKSMGLRVKQQFLDLLELSLQAGYRSRMQDLSWDNLGILNEWKQRYPEADPVALHERIWQRELVCAGGGKYVWNEAWQTMESTVFGHPANPKKGQGLPPQLKEFKSANFGVTFEVSGLRARVELER